MKTKNVSLAIAAFVFAIGSAFASMFATVPVYVKGQMVEDASYECIDTQATCTAIGNSTCTITVPLRNGGTATAQSNAAPFTYQNSVCTTVLKSDRVEAFTSPLTGNNRPIAIQ